MTDNNNFLKLWGMPVYLAFITVVGLVSAILGTGLWHYISWISLTVPLYYMIKFGWKYFS